MSTHNIGFYEEISKIILNYHQISSNMHLIVPRLFEEKRRDIVFGFPSFRPSFRPPNIVGTLCAQLLLQFYADSFKTLQMFLSWSEDMHVVWILS